MKSQLVEPFAADMEQAAELLELAIPDALEGCKPLILDNILENFARQETPDGIAWPDRQVEGDGHPLLVETNTVGSGSLLAAATGQGGGHVCRIEDNALFIGVDKLGGIGGIPGAAVHNYGFEEKNIPQREYLGIGERTTELCAEVVVDKLLEMLV